MIINGGCTYTTSGGTVVDYSEDIRWSDRHWGKYNNGMAKYLDSLGDAGPYWTGSVEWDVYVERYGKRLLITGDRGFVHVDKFPSEVKAEEVFDAIDAAYSTWANGEEA